MPNKLSTYQEVVQITQTYLGPAAERFIDRQIENHLSIDPKKLSPRDLIELIDWIKISVSFLTDDNQLIEDYIYQLQAVIDSSKDPR